ncbi:hypothetical protein EJ02DRAFT_131165 [Clathrospora elynae]|uniref:Mid2 domain-containing protein n=1 Tax=Clathrospora elynae TaxID=706981 RepID=A0A6A5SUS7_9PLEO|nr:hypothetical protein EJ02DRAFT_131165 [Clathrospora elynae]
MPTTLTWLRAAAVAALVTQATAQQCYYRNGDKAPDTEKACSSAKGSACCPDKWECLDNGLCYYPSNNLYGRYSCTDKDWNSPGCASNMCTYGGTAGGGESITQCSNHDNNWCCNGDAQHVNCCQESPSPRPFFALQDGNAYATIGSNKAMIAPDLSGITGLASGTGGGSGGASSASQTPAPTSSDAPSSAGSRAPSATAATVQTSAAPFTSVSTHVSTGPGGAATIYVTYMVTPSSSPTASASSTSASESGSGKMSNLGVIVGCAVGIPLALALVGIVFWMFRKRRQQKANPYKESPEMEGDSAGFAGGAAGKLGKKDLFRHSRPGTTEIDGNPVGAGRPISTVKGHAELPSGNGFQPGHGTAYTPDSVGIGGGNGDRHTWSSVPPQYSPAQNQTGFNHHPEAMELDGTSAMPIINEKTETSQGPQQYAAYRPPHAAELPTVMTPPEDVEKQMPR